MTLEQTKNAPRRRVGEHRSRDPAERRQEPGRHVEAVLPEAGLQVSRRRSLRADHRELGRSVRRRAPGAGSSSGATWCGVGRIPIAAGAQKVDFVADEGYEVTPLRPGIRRPAEPGRRARATPSGRSTARRASSARRSCLSGWSEGKNFMEYDLVYLQPRHAVLGRQKHRRARIRQGGEPTDEPPDPARTEVIQLSELAQTVFLAADEAVDVGECSADSLGAGLAHEGRGVVPRRCSRCLRTARPMLACCRSAPTAGRRRRGRGRARSSPRPYAAHDVHHHLRVGEAGHRAVGAARQLLGQEQAAAVAVKMEAGASSPGRSPRGAPRAWQGRGSPRA